MTVFVCLLHEASRIVSHQLTDMDEFCHDLIGLFVPLPDTSKLEKLNRELEKSEKKLRKAINDEKALQHQLKQLTRKERTHRLCTRGGMLESFLQEPERLTDDDVMLLLKLIFHRQDTQELLKKLLEREMPEPP